MGETKYFAQRSEEMVAGPGQKQYRDTNSYRAKETKTSRRFNFFRKTALKCWKQHVFKTGPRSEVCLMLIFFAILQYCDSGIVIALGR
jgi:hypothetical protein